MIVNCINKNLLRLTYRNELTDMFFEYISYIKNLKASEISRNSKSVNNLGLGAQH